jgi:hypothetical protein
MYGQSREVLQLASLRVGTSADSVKVKIIL